LGSSVAPCRVAYNRAPHKTTGVSPFKTVYGLDPLTPRYLTPGAIKERPSVEAKKRVKEIKGIHDKVREKIEKTNANYQSQANKHRRKVFFQLGDLIWVHLRMKRLP